MSSDPVLGISQNAYGGTDFESIDWTRVSQNATYLNDMFQESATWPELVNACPVGGPPIVSIPCGVVNAVALGIAGAAALEIILQSARARGNQIDSGIQEELQDPKYRGLDPCTALQAMLDQAKAAGDTKRAGRIVKTQKG